MRSSYMHRNPLAANPARKENEEKMGSQSRLFLRDKLLMDFILQKKFMILAMIFSISASGYLYAAAPVLIAEENFEGVMSCKLSSVGSFPVSPGIKTGMGVGGSHAYGFGRSSCGANAWDGYVNDLTFTFSKKCVITKVEFWEIERYDNWGSQGWLIANGNRINDTTFGRLPSNDRIADSSFRKREFSLDIVSSGLTFRCWDITDRSELFVDDIKIYGYVYDDTFTVAFNANGGVGNAIPLQGFSVNTPQKLYKNVYRKDDYVFQGWASNSVERAISGIVDFIDEQEITVDSDMTLYAVWGKHYSAPTNLEATQYHNQHPQGVKLTWSPVAGAPGYVILRKIVGENEFYPVGATPDTEYINKVATIPNVKDFKAQYAVAVADWQGNDPNTIVYLSPWSTAEWGCWRENPPPTVEHRPPRVIGMVKSNTNPMLSGVKGANVYTIEFNDDYDKSGYVFKQARITGVGLRNGKRYDFTSATRSVTVDIPAGEHGPWSFEGRAVFTETASGKEYTTEPPYLLENERVYFIRTGRDGVKVPEAKTAEVFTLIPNWYKYWIRDKALDLMRERDVYYGLGCIGNDAESEVLKLMVYTGAYTITSDGSIYVLDNAIKKDFSKEITIGGGKIRLQTPGLNKGTASISNLAEVMEHELTHRLMAQKRGWKGSGDIRWLWFNDDTDKDGLSKSLESELSAETGLTFNPDKSDSFGFYDVMKGAYNKKECDEEVYAHWRGTIEYRKAYFATKIHPEKDYSWEQGDTTSKRASPNMHMAALEDANTDDEEAKATYSSGLLNNIFIFGGDTDAEYENDNLSIISIDNLNVVNSGLSSGYDHLTVDVRCSAKEYDYGTIFVLLSDESGNPVAWASRTGEIAAGENTYTLTFAGQVLYMSHKSGYKIYRATMCKGANLSPVAALTTNLSTTGTYKWSDFRTDNVTIQSLALLEADGRVRVDAEIVVPNEEGVYDLSSYLCDVGTHDYVAEASQTNVVLHAGTNAVSLAFANSDIQMNAVSNAFAISKFTVEKDGEIVAAYNGETTLNVADETILNPTNAVLVFDEATVTNELVMTEGGALYSGVNFAFDVENSCTNAVDYTLTAYLNSTNSLTVDMATFDLSLTSGVNRITIPFLGAKIKASEISGPYVLSCVRLESKDDAIASQTLRMDSRAPDCAASDFQGNVIERIVDISRAENRNDSIVVNVSFETGCAVSGTVKASLIDAGTNVVMFGHADFAADCAGTNTVEICFAVSNVIASACSMPLRVAYISIEPIDKLIPGLSDDTHELEITELYTERSACPVFSPVTKTVFFSGSQTVEISCATPGAEIRYTFDGTEPTESSMLYNGSFAITNSAVVKAKAFAERMRPSETAVAEYVRAAIVGDNLVQDRSMGAGGVQTLRIPVPGAYQMSFNYSQGGDIELRLSQNGTTQTLAVVSASSAGSTNFVFEIAGAGDYELSVCDPLSGETQPAVVSELTISIPDTRANRGKYWIYETEGTWGSTGEWLSGFGFVNGKISVDGTNIFTAATSSIGRYVTILTAFEFGDLGHGDYEDEAKAGICIGVGENGSQTFQVFVSEGGYKKWIDVSGDGLPEPELNVPYTLKFTFDCTNLTYEVALVKSEGKETPLTHGSTNSFPFAETGDAAIRQFEYAGYGKVFSLQGSYNGTEDGFTQGDTLVLDGNQIPAITEGQAAWLNSMNSYDVVKMKASSMGRLDFEEAYLLNLDITQDAFGLGMFKVEGIEVTETEVKIQVGLNRVGAVQTNQSGEKRNAPINGILKLYGGETPQAKNILNATRVTDANFGESNTATFTYPRNGSAKFFRPAIEAPTK